MGEALTLESLCGEHYLEGVERGSVTMPPRYHGDDPEEANCLTFILDGVAYQVIEDPQDDHRSSMREIRVGSRGEVKNRFRPVEVLARMKLDDGQTNDILQLVDLGTGEVILEAGTANTDDYYPWFVAEWSPERMTGNWGKGKETIA